MKDYSCVNRKTPCALSVKNRERGKRLLRLGSTAHAWAAAGERGPLEAPRRPPNEGASAREHGVMCVSVENFVCNN